MRPHDGRVVSNFIVQALKGEPLTVYGSGDQTRSFCYVEDEINGLVKLLLAPDTEDMHLPVNIGNPHEMTVLEIAETIVQLTGSKSKIIFEPLPEDDPKVRRPDITRAMQLLDWTPRITLEDGLTRTIEYFKTRLQPSVVSRQSSVGLM
jgi:nucleoside-diphosphate-sugar epimerase